MTSTTLSLFNKLRPVSVGFDSVFDHFESMFSDMPSLTTNYPPYNIVKTSENDYLIEIALAGFSREDIKNMTLKLIHWLSVKYQAL